MAWASAWVVRRQHMLMTELRAAQEAVSQQAAERERARIARELHDVMAHSLTVTLLHLSAARLAVEAGEGDGARALVEAERVGRQCLADVRRAVGLLGHGPAGSTGPPLAGLDGIPGLVAEYRAAGVDVDLQVGGDLAAVPPSTGLVIFRIAEESLANASRHAPGAHVDVGLSVAAGGDRVSLLVVNGRSTEPPVGADDGGAGGLGLVGMRERAALVGGRLEAGPTAGGWRVSILAPLGDG